MSNPDPFADPGSGRGIQWEPLKGRLLLITPHSVEEKVKTKYTRPGEDGKDAIRADVVVLDGPDASDTTPDVLVFPGVLVAQLRSKIGQKVIGRLGQGIATGGNNPPWRLDQATDADKKIGMTYLANGVVNADLPPF